MQHHMSVAYYVPLEVTSFFKLL